MNKSSSKQELINILKPFEQEHLVKFWDELDETQKEQFADDLKQTDFAELNAYFKQVSSSKDQTVKEIDSLMKPVPNELKGSYSKSSQEQLSAYEANGLKAIAEGQVAVLLLAGGQGTRLGVKYPKGMYSVDLQSGKSLYHLQAERLIRIKQLAKQRFPSKIQSKQTESSIPLYIMTSEHTQESTINYFNKHDYFGLDKENVFFFEQFMLPCLTNQGKVILDKKHKLSKAPDGNGGLYKALLKRKVLDDMNQRGVKYIHIYCVDNILVKMADPIFVGFCINKDANCAAKVVKKNEPDEKVGVICKVEDRFQVVEYSEISEVTRNLRDKENDLLYNAGNICNHFLNTDFLNQLCRNHENELRHHVAEKKIAFIDENGDRIEPKSNNGIKLEKFVFDVFPFSTNFAIWEVLREDEFSPLKNGDDAKKETPTTCRNDLSNQHLKWLLEAGATFAADIEPIRENEHQSRLDIEISPLVSYNGEDLSIVNGKTLRKPLKIDIDKTHNKLTFNGLDLETYEEQNCIISA
jgi:UDP-N-acetylglucosamine/UDP-N-acetylgalactosamine diphosphorylase